MKAVKDFFLRKRAGFYIGAVVALLMLVTTIVYATGFREGSGIEDYASAGVWVLSLLAFLSFAGLCIFPQTNKFAPVALTLFAFIGMLQFYAAGYMFFSQVFYGGFNMEGFFGMNKSFLFCIIVFLLSVILGNVSIYLKQEKAETGSVKPAGPEPAEKASAYAEEPKAEKVIEQAAQPAEVLEPSKKEAVVQEPAAESPVRTDAQTAPAVKKTASTVAKKPAGVITAKKSTAAKKEDKQ